MYAIGQGVPQDDSEAVKWYRLAADQGFAIAQYNLGFVYAYGRGVRQDYVEAVKWYRKAADQGVEPSDDESEPLVNIENYIWANISVEFGYEEVTNNQENFSKRLSSETLKIAQQKVVKLIEEIQKRTASKKN